MSIELSMRAVWLGLTLLLLSSCAETATGAVKCGMRGDDATLREVLTVSKSCPQCLLDKVIAIDKSCPQDPAIGILGFYASERTKRYQDAIRFYERLVDTPGVSFEVHADAGFIYQALGNKGAALTAYQRSLQQSSDSFVRFEAARIMIDLGMLDASIRELQKVMAETEESRRLASPGVIGSEAVYDDAAFALAEVFVAQGDLASARTTYERILSLYPEDERALEALRTLANREVK